MYCCIGTNCILVESHNHHRIRLKRPHEPEQNERIVIYHSLHLAILQLLLIALAQVIRAMQPIQHANDAEINYELLVMRIMASRNAAQEIVPAVHRRGLQQLQAYPREIRQHVHVEQLCRDDEREQVRKQVLDRMCVLRREGHGRREEVVLLVDALVQRRGVQEPVDVVEEDLAHGETEDDVADEFEERGDAW